MAWTLPASLFRGDPAHDPRVVAQQFVDAVAHTDLAVDTLTTAERAAALLPGDPGALARVAVEIQRHLASLPRDEYGRSALRGGRVQSAVQAALEALARHGLPFTDAQIEALADLVPERLDCWSVGAEVALPLAALTDRLARRPGDTTAGRAGARLLDRVRDATENASSEKRRAELLTRIRGLLAASGSLADRCAMAFGDGDAWGAAVRAEVVARFAAVDGAADLVGFASRRIPSKVPSSKWRKECGRALAGCPSAGGLLHAALSPLPSVPDTPCPTPYGAVAMYLTPENAETAKALLWMLVEARTAWGPSLLADVAIHCAPGPRNQKLSNAAVLILGALGDRAAVGQLSRARLRIRNRNTRRQIDEALAGASAKAGVSPAELLEMCVPDFGLGPDGRRAVALGDVTAVVEVRGAADARLTWRDAAGAESKAPPAEIRAAHAAEVAALKSDLKEIRTTLATERARIEDLLGGARTWPVAVWTERYVRHPVTGPAARGLLWDVPISGGARRTGIVRGADGTPADASGARIAVAADGDVRLWHPIRSAPDEIEAWRRRIVAEEIVQPVKQAFREVYVVTPAEQRTRVYSNRFAGHVLRYRQASALMKARMWQANALGGWDGGREGVATREFPDQGMRAEFFHEAIHADAAEAVVVHCTTDQVRFFRTGDAEPVPLADVPPLVFSEAMRDVDLFVGVASVAADPNWLDRGENRGFAEAWTEASFGALQESAKIRRDALLRIVPRLRIASRCTVEDRWLVVRGDLATYRIHVGSANVQMEPGSRYLCIVVDRGAPRSATSRVYLPFEEDGTLSVLLSKAFLLADDRRIKDPTILAQMRPVQRAPRHTRE